jgi:hypothetical protein
MSISGGFFLGSGSIDGTPVYLYYTCNNGEYLLDYVNARGTAIRYIADNSKPRIETEAEGYYRKTYWSDEWKWHAKGELYQKIIIYVPENSIRQYYLDSEPQ